MNRLAVLSTRRLEPGASVAHAHTWLTEPVTMDAPALAVMTDLRRVKAAVIDPGASLRQAEQAMIYQGVRMLFVVNEMPVIVGLVTSTDLLDDRQMRVVQQRNLRHDEICVADVMTELAALDAVDLDSLRVATVSNLVATLKKLGRNHLLVVDGAPDAICGVVSRSQIERQLGERIDVVEVANSFAEIGKMLA